MASRVSLASSGLTLTSHHLSQFGRRLCQLIQVPVDSEILGIGIGDPGLVAVRRHPHKELDGLVSLAAGARGLGVILPRLNFRC